MFSYYSTTHFRHIEYHIKAGWVYYHISNVTKETTALVMYDPNTFFYVVPLFLMALRISQTYVIYHKYDKHYK